jgi:hypothetical protein
MRLFVPAEHWRGAGDIAAFGRLSVRRKAIGTHAAFYCGPVTENL